MSLRDPRKRYRRFLRAMRFFSARAVLVAAFVARRAFLARLLGAFFFALRLATFFLAFFFTLRFTLRLVAFLLAVLRLAVLRLSLIHI